jgi:type I restriction enzyme M protein
MMLRPDPSGTRFVWNFCCTGILDQYQLTGVFADWWFAHQDDLRSLDYRGFAAVVDRWVVTRSDRALCLPGGLAHERVLNILGDDLRSRVE